METPVRTPELSADAIHLWHLHLPELAGRLDALHTLLSEKEQARAARFHREADRQTSIAARGALRILLSGYTGIPAARLAFQYSENGKPSLVPPGSVSQASRLPPAEQPGRRDACDRVSFNLSHSGDRIVLAFARGGNLGVDIEKIRPGMDVLSIAARYFTPAERAQIGNAASPQEMFFRLWTRKEAYVKACGSALFRELDHFAVPISGSRNGWFFQGLETGPQHAAAIVADKPLDNLVEYGFGGLQWEN